MGFDIIGPTRHVRASQGDEGDRPCYDLLALAAELGPAGPQLGRLHQRFHDSTTLSHARGEVKAFRDEVARLRQAYRLRLESELISSGRVRTRDPAVRRLLLDQLITADVVARVLDELRLLCEEAIEAGADVRCVGD